MMQLHDAIQTIQHTSEDRLLSLTLSELLDAQAARFGDAPCVVQPHLGMQTTYAALNDKVHRIAGALLAIGVQKGEHIVVFGDGGVDSIAMMFAAAQIGAVLAVVDGGSKRHQLEYILRQSEAVTLVVFGGEAQRRAVSAMLPALCTCRAGKLHDVELPFLRSVIYRGEMELSGAYLWQDFIGIDSKMDSMPQVVGHDLADNVYSQALAESPVGRLVSQYSILNNGRDIGRLIGLNPQDRLCIAAPLTQSFARVQGVVACIAHGAAMVLPHAYTVDAVCAAIGQAGVTALLADQQGWTAISQSAAAQNRVAGIKGLMVGQNQGAQLAAYSIIKRCHPAKMVLTYINDVSPLAIMACEDKEDGTLTAMQPLAHLQVCIAQAKTGRPLAAGQEGELLVRGYAVMQGCCKMPHITRKLVDEAGWLHTAELAMMDENGYVKYMGYMRDRIVHGSQNIDPREIEGFLCTHPAVSQARVIGVTSRGYGQQAMAYVILKDGVRILEDALIHYICKGLSRSKMPRYLRIVEAFPSFGDEFQHISAGHFRGMRTKSGAGHAAVTG